MRKLILCIWLLVLVIQLSAQDIIVSYEIVTGSPHVDTVLVYMQSADSDSREVGAISFSFCFQDSTLPQVSAIQSDFLTLWGSSYEKSTIHPFPSHRDGIPFQKKLSYGIAAFQAQTFKVPGSAFGAIPVMKIPFTHQGIGKYYLERPNQNKDVSVGNAKGERYDILIIDKAQPFPVEWLYLEAEPRADRKVELTWATASETHNDYFSIEKSPNGTDFSEIAKVHGAFFVTTPQNYEYLDATQMFAHTHYRLVQVDLSGRRTYSDVIEVKFPDIAGSWLNVYPNPAEDFIMLDPLVEMKGFHHFRLIDVTGALVSGHDWQPIQKKMKVSVKGLPSGIYIFQSKDETGKVDLLRLVKK